MITLTATPSSSAIALRWTNDSPSTGQTYYVYRQAKDQPAPGLLGTTYDPVWDDATAVPGVLYQYMISTTVVESSNQIASEIPAPAPAPMTKRVLGKGTRAGGVMHMRTLAAWGTRRALLYTEILPAAPWSRHSLMLWDGPTGKTVNTPCPEMDTTGANENVVSNAAIAFTADGSELWTWSVNQRPAWAYNPTAKTLTLIKAVVPPTLRRYRVQSDLTLVPLDFWVLLDNTSVTSDLVALTDGRLVAIGYTLADTLATNLVKLRYVFITPGGNPVEFTGPTIDGQSGVTGQVCIVAAQHPVSGTVHVYSKGDSAHRMVLTEIDPQSMGIVEQTLNFVDYHDGVDNVEGEFPRLCVVRDAAAGLLHVGYQNEHYEFVQYPIVTEFVKGCWASVVSVTSGGRKTFHRWSAGLMERVWGFNMTQDPKGNFILVGRTPLTATPPYFLDVSAVRQQGDSWAPPVYLGATATLTHDEILAVGTTVVFRDAGNQLWHIELAP